MARLLVDIDGQAANGQRGTRLEFKHSWSFDADGSGADIEFAISIQRHVAAIAVDLYGVSFFVLDDEAVVVEEDLAAFLMGNLDRAARTVVEEQVMLAWELAVSSVFFLCSLYPFFQ